MASSLHRVARTVSCISRSIYHGYSFYSMHGASVTVSSQKWRYTNNYQQPTFIGSLFLIPLLGYSYFNCTAEKMDIHVPDHSINFQPNFMNNKHIPISINNESLTKSPLAHSATNHRTTGLHSAITINPFKLAQWCQNHKFYTCALWLYSLYLLTPRNNFHHLDALESSAIIYYNEFKDYAKALEMFNRLGTNYGILARQEFPIGYCYAHLDPPDYDKAIHWYELGVKHRLGKDQTCENAYHHLFVICYQEKQDWERALYYAELLGDEYIHEKNWEFEVAMAAYMREEYDKAVKYFTLYTENAASEIDGIMIAYQCIAHAYRERKLVKEALAWFLKIDEERMIKNNQEGYIGDCYVGLGDEENSVKWFELMMINEDTKETYTRESVVQCCRNIAGYYFEKGEYGKAIEKGWNHMTDEELVQDENDFTLSIAYNLVGDVEMQLKYLKMFVDRKGDKIGEYWPDKFKTSSTADETVSILKDMKKVYVEYATEIAELMAYFEGSV